MITPRRSWPQVSLGNLISPSPVLSAGSRIFPILSMTMESGLVDQSNKFKKRVASANTADYKVVKRGQLVVGFPIDEGVLSFQKLYDKAIVSPAYGIWDLVDESRVFRPYLEGFLRSPKAITYYQSKLRSTTARRRSLDRPTFTALEIPLPPLEEQRRIAGILDRADALRRKQQQMLTRADEFLRATFLHMFGDPVTNPKGWEVQQLGNLAELINGDRSANYPSKKDLVSEGIPFLNTKNIVRGSLDLVELSFITREKFNSLGRGKLEKGDLIITLRGSLGLCAEFNNSFETGFINAQMMIIRSKPSLNNRYFLYMTMLNSVKTLLQRMGSGSAVPQLTATQVAQWKIPLPPLEEQRQFLALENSYQKLRSFLGTSALKSTHLFNALSQRAFRGEL